MTDDTKKRLSEIEKELVLIRERLRILWLLGMSFVGLALTSIATALIASVVKGVE